jgi:hypothetical protein
MQPAPLSLRRYHQATLLSKLLEGQFRRTFGEYQSMSAFGGKADITIERFNVRL